MFGLFKKQIHEPLKLQRRDLENYPPKFLKKFINGEDCDELSKGHGEFGSITNPIPVNGSLGEIKYLGKLRGKSGNALFFHRIGSVSSPVTDNSLDLYEVVCMDGSQWNKLHFSMYHPRRSNKTPKGYSLTPFNKSLKMDMPFAYGVNSLVNNFPLSLPEEIINFYGESPGKTFARHTQEKLNKYNFNTNIESVTEKADVSPVSEDSSETVLAKDPIIESFDPITIVVSKEEVMSSDISSICDVLNELIKSPEIAQNYQEKINFTFDGFNEHPQELFEIMEVRRFVHEVDNLFPFWLYFLSKNHLGLQNLLFCFLPPFLTDEAKQEIFPKKIEELLCNRWFPALNQIGTFLGLSSDENEEITQRTFSYIGSGPINH